MLSKKHQKFCKIVKYSDYLLTLAFVVNGCISIPVFGSLVSFPAVIACSAVGTKICGITA